MPETHYLELVNEDGEWQELYCYECCRHMWMTWPPDYQKVVCEVGDESKEHDAYTGTDILMIRVKESEPIKDDPVWEWAMQHQDLLEGLDC